MCSYYYFVDEINEKIKNDRFLYVNLVYVYNIIIMIVVNIMNY
jgi:hypothetical protein